MANGRVTIADVARAAGVSPGAVSFALNDRPGVGPDTRRRILEVAAQLQWRPNVRARSLSSSRAFALGLVIARQPQLLSTDPFFPAFIAGIETVLAEVGVSLVLNVVTDDEAEEATYRRLAAESRVDGVFLTDLRHDDFRIPLLEELELPAVTLGEPDNDSAFRCIRADDGVGITALVELLISHGHRRIAHVAGPVSLLHAAHRLQSWQRAIAAAGCDPERFVVSDFSAAGGAAATGRLLDAPETPTAIVYGNDVMAIAGMAVAQQRGYRVPADLSITGFDDTELATYVNPALTTVRTDAYDWGRQAATVLLDVLADRPTADLDLPAPPLVLRASVAAAHPASKPETL